MPPSEDSNPIVEKIKTIFVKNKLSLSVAESLTCGNLQAQIGAVSGASNYFSGGITAYSINEKVNILKVDEAEAQRTNCVSERVAIEMAAGAATLFESNFSISTTGYAEKFGSIEEPFAYFAIYHDNADSENGIIQSGLIKGGHRNRAAVQTLVVDTVLNALLNCIEKIYPSEA